MREHARLGRAHRKRDPQPAGAAPVRIDRQLGVQVLVQILDGIETGRQRLERPPPRILRRLKKNKIKARDADTRVSSTRRHDFHGKSERCVAESVGSRFLIPVLCVFRSPTSNLVSAFLVYFFVFLAARLQN